MHWLKPQYLNAQTFIQMSLSSGENLKKNPQKIYNVPRKNMVLSRLKETGSVSDSQSVFALPLKNMKGFLESHRLIIKYLEPANA